MSELRESTGTRYKCRRCKGTFILGDIDSTPAKHRYQQCPTCMFMNALPNKTLAQLTRRQPKYSTPIELEYLKANIYPGLDLTKVLTETRTGELRGPTTVFFENIVRLQSLFILPIVTSAYSRLFEQKKAEAVSRLTVPPNDPGYKEALDDATTQLCLQWMATSTEQTRGKFISQYGAGTFFRLSSAPIRAGSEAILVSQLTGMWTAFESLAGDLWIAALNANPRILAALVGDRDRISRAAGRIPKRGRADSVDEPKEQAGTVEREAIDRISRGTFNLRRKMGDLLRESFSFIKLNGIRIAYSRAFSERYEKIDSALSNPALDALNVVRNVIVHSAGWIDDEYFEKSKSMPLVPKGAKGDQIMVDGKLVAALIMPVYDA